MDETYEANEFSTVLNACGRHGQDDVGIGVALGQEGFAEQARTLLQLHRKMLREGIEFANKNTQDLGSLFLLDGRGIIDEGIVGVVCGMIVEQRWRKPILGIATSDKKGWLKLSARGRSADLSAAMKTAGKEAGGIGGGHAMAAGAEIPAAGLDSFLLSFSSSVDKAKKTKEKL